MFYEGVKPVGVEEGNEKSIVNELISVAILLSLEGVKSYGVCHKNQDRAFITELGPRLTVFGVFDGHGSSGHHVSQFVCDYFQQRVSDDLARRSTYTETEVLSWMGSTFARVDVHHNPSQAARLSSLRSGCTASVALRLDDVVYVAYIGDSKVAAFQFHGKKPGKRVCACDWVCTSTKFSRLHPSNEHIAVCLMETHEHNPGSPTELPRIRETGSMVSEYHHPLFSKPISRITEAGLSVSRSFGDYAARPHGVISEPEFIRIQIPIRRISRRSGKKSSHYPLILVLGSDGLWDTIQAPELLNFITNTLQSREQVGFHHNPKIATDTYIGVPTRGKWSLAAVV